MNDPRDRVLVERAAERFEVGDVATHQRQPLTLLRREDELQPVRRIAEVVAHRLVAVLQHGFHRPGAQAPERPGDQDALAQYTALPPEMSYVAPVEKEHSSLASQHTSAATSSTLPRRPIGIRSTM